MSGRTMPNWLRKRAELTPERVAVEADGERWSFAELDERAASLALRLRGLGLQPGQHVALLLQNGLPMVELIHACEYAGVVLVMLNTRLTAREMAWQVEDAQALFLFCDDQNAQKANDVAVLHPATTVCNTNGLRDNPTVEATLSTEFDLEALHTIVYTSGTTGHPKGVVLSYGNHWWSAIGSALNLGIHADDRWLVCVPLFHVSGLSILMRSVIYGMTAVVHTSFDAVAANEAILNDGVTIVSVVGTMLTRMVDELGDQRYPDAFRCMLAGGGPVFRPLLERCRDQRIPIYQTYGLTETASQIVTLSPEHMLSKMASAGKALFPVELRIEQDGVPQPPGAAGEIVVRGPNVTHGYYRRPDATAKAIRGGWLHTGDIGYLDELGFLYVLDRRTDLIVTGGENVYPAEVEGVLLAHPAIEDVGVIGLNDEEWGQVPVACVKLRRDRAADESELLAFCRQKMAKYKVPIAVRFVEELPRNASNKLMRRALRDLFGEKDN